MNRETIQRMKTETKTTLLCLRNQDWKTIKVEGEKINKLLTHLNEITELNELIYEVVKLVCEKIRVPLKNTNKNLKLGLQIK